MAEMAASADATAAASTDDDAAAAKAAADELFRERKYTDAIDKYGAAIALNPSLHTLFSNRAACHEKLAKDAWGAEKRAILARGVADAEACTTLAPDFVRGFARLAALKARARVSNVACAPSSGPTP